MERIKVRQQKFKRGKEKMLSIAQESGEGQTLGQPEEDDDDDGMRMAAGGLSLCSYKSWHWGYMITSSAQGEWESVLMPN